MIGMCLLRKNQPMGLLSTLGYTWITYLTRSNMFSASYKSNADNLKMKTNFAAVSPKISANNFHNQWSQENNMGKTIFLLGSPGCGKTTVGRMLGAKTNLSVLDIDDHYLEKYWNTSVANKLAAVGGRQFVEEEGRALLHFTAPSNTVVSLTGSNPMHKEAMTHIRKQGLVVFLDVMQKDILARLEAMKVNRIVGQEEGTPMAAILEYRQQFYENSYDIRVICEEGESAESISEKVKAAVDEYYAHDAYVSTRGHKQDADFNDVVLHGLAPDGGLFVPDRKIPHFTLGQWRRMVDLSYTERARRVLERWIHPRDVNPAQLRTMINQAYSEEKFPNPNGVFPVQHLYENIYLAELFHGPTASFKDAALQLLPHFFQHAVVKARSKGVLTASDKFLILVATSGDTGSAVLYGFQQLAEQHNNDVSVLVLYPQHGISNLQRRQMTSLPSPGLHVVGVQSDFDFCQSSIKQIFNDAEFASQLTNISGYQLSAANSINWGRLLPQIVYHASSYLDLVKQGAIAMGEKVDLCIPTGNFGNILSAFYAKEMGIPIGRLICASNVNNVLTAFLQNGVYDISNRKLHVTSSPAIDILKSSNLERFLYQMSGSDADYINKCYQSLQDCGRFTIPAKMLDKIQDHISADWCSEQDSLNTIRTTFSKTGGGYVIDPHTAVGVAVAERFNRVSNCAVKNRSGSATMLVASTAHYAKFHDDVFASLKEELNMQSPDLFKKDGTTMSKKSLDISHFAKIVTRPPMNESLKRSVARPEVRDKTIKADINHIKSDILKFVEQEHLRTE